jgi:hypothetical protein
VAHLQARPQRRGKGLVLLADSSRMSAGTQMAMRRLRTGLWFIIVRGA